MITPYSDDKMEWNEYAGRYYLTENALRELGIDIQGRFDEANETNQYAIRAFIVKNTTMIYNYLHAHTMSNAEQDKAIETIETCRKKLYLALCENMLSLFAYGDRQNSPDERERAVAIPQSVKDILDEMIPELGHTMTYAGRW